MSPYDIVLRLVRRGDSVFLEASSERGETESVKVDLPFLRPQYRRALALAMGGIQVDLAKWHKDKAAFEALKELGFADEQGPFQDVHERVGKLLFKSLFSSAMGVLEALHAAVDQGEKGGPPTRVEFHVVHEDAELDSLPWELLYEDTVRNFLFRTRCASLVRYIRFPGTLSLKFDKINQLNVLLVAPRPADPKDPSVVVLEDMEGREIEKVLGEVKPNNLVRFERLQSKPNESSWDTLTAYLRNKGNPVPHVIHFDCHGGFGRKCFSCNRLNSAGAQECSFCGARALGNRDEGYLAFELEDKRPHWVSAQELYSLLKGCGIRLCVLSACHSGKVGGGSVFEGVGPSLIRAGIPAVVAMQFAVTVDMAKVFTREFYGSIVQRAPIVAAVAQARAAMANDRTAWYRPVLYLRTNDDNPDGTIFNFAVPAGPVPDTRQSQKSFYDQTHTAPPVDPFAILHWDRDQVVVPFLAKIKSRDDPLRVIALHGPPNADAGFTSLYNRLEEYCKDAARKSPLFYQQLNLKEEAAFPRIFAMLLLQRLFEKALAAGMSDAQNPFEAAREEMERFLNKGKPDPSQIASTLLKLLCRIEPHFGIVLLLRVPQRIEDETAQFLRILTIGSPKLKGLLIVLASEKSRLEFLTEDLPEANHVLPLDLPVISDDLCLEWALALGVPMTQNRAAKLNKDADHNPDKIRIHLRAIKSYLEEDETSTSLSGQGKVNGRGRA